MVASLFDRKFISLAKGILVMIILAGLVGGSWFFESERRRQQWQVDAQLAAISKLKAKQIVDWRLRLVADVALLAESPFFVNGVESFFEELSLDPAAALMTRIRSISYHGHYPGILLLDQQHNVRVGYGPLVHTEIHSDLAAVQQAALRQGRPVISELFLAGQPEKIYLAVASPLFRQGKGKGEIFGTIILISDASQFLYPLVTSWPVPSRTAESYLIRADGPDVLFLSELLQLSDSALKLRQPRTDSDRPAVQAVVGGLASGRGHDYRGQPVIFHSHQIEDSRWHLVSKIDADEAFAGWSFISLMLLLILFGMAGMLAALAVVFWQQRKKFHYQQLYAAEQRLRRSAERSSIILQGIGDGVLVVDMAGRLESHNPMAEQLIDWPSQDTTGWPLSQLFQLVDQTSGVELENPAQQVLRSGVAVDLTDQILLVRRDGRKIPVTVSGSPVHDHHGRISGVVLVFHDESKRWLMRQVMEKRLRIVEFANSHSLDELLCKVLDEIGGLVDSPLGFFYLVAADQQTLSLRQWLNRMEGECGTAQADGLLLPDRPAGGIWADCLQCRKGIIDNAAAAQPSWAGPQFDDGLVERGLVVPIKHRERIVAMVGVGNKTVDYDWMDLEMVGYLAEVVYQTIEAKQVADVLRLSLQTSDDLVRAIPAGLLIFQHQDPDRLRLVSGNLAAARLIGLDLAAMVGRQFAEVWPAAAKGGLGEKLLEVVRSSEMFEIEDLQYAENQLIGAFCIRAFVLPGERLAVAFEDISALKAAEQEKDKIQGQLQQAQKMESVGRLAGGVAHDFNNMLSVIIGNAEMALEHAGPGSEVGKELEEIKKAAQRSADLTRQLLAFARKQEVSPQIVNLNVTIEAMLRMLRRLIGEDIKLAWLPQTGLKSTFIDPSQVDQILANLCVNARDAIRGVGKITISTENVTLTEQYCRDLPGFVAGDYVLLSFSDSGSGITEENLKHIFEPFFTTKKQGEGTGLGLAMIYGIVKQNGGSIKVDSEPEQGTVFCIYLPQYVSETEENETLPAAEIPFGLGEIVLLVEDETVILELNTRILKRLGYQVLATSSPAEALALVADHGETIALLISDIVMPEMNGNDLAKAISEIRPGMKCLFVSGYTANVIARQGFLPEGMQFLQKPFMKKDLAAKIHEILAA